jgi:hypothetical protein
MQTTTELVNSLAADMRATIAALEHIDGELTYSQLMWRPPDGQWSIAQVIEHLALTDGPCMEPIARLLAHAPRGDERWKPTIMGRIITWAVDPRRSGRREPEKGSCRRLNHAPASSATTFRCGYGCSHCSNSREV